MTNRCKHGHPWSEANTRWHVRRGTQRYRVCRQCAAQRSRLRYRNDASFREAEKARASANYYARQT